jgi:hypothetical protein
LPASPARAAFHRSVEGQQIGLEGNVVDQPDNVGDLGRRLRDPLHGLIGLQHYRAAGFRIAGDAACLWLASSAWLALSTTVRLNCSIAAEVSSIVAA